MASGAKLSAMVPQCFGHGAMLCRPWCHIVLAMVPCLVAMVPQFCDLSAMFTDHGARVFLARCHVLSAVVPQCLAKVPYFIGHGTAVFGAILEYPILFQKQPLFN